MAYFDTEAAVLIAKTAGKRHSRRVEVFAVQIHEDFNVHQGPGDEDELKGNAGDYIVAGDEKGIEVMSPKTFRELFKSTRKRKANIAKDSPPGAPPAANPEDN